MEVLHLGISSSVPSFLKHVPSKVFSDAGDLKKHIHTIHENQKDQNDFKCDSCGKLLSAGDLKKHIHAVHEGHNDYKCEYCDKPFSLAGDLKTHIHTVHEGHLFFQ